MNAALVSCLEATLAPLCTGGDYALIDYPLYHNPGDAAIWAGARIVLERIMGRPPTHVSTLRRFDADACRKAVRGGTVFLLGGGNFGGLYPRHHAQRLDVVQALAGVPVVQLPFSAAGLLDDADLLERTRAVLSGHGGVTLIAREDATRKTLASALGISAPLAPDPAHALSPTAGKARLDVTHLVRRDREAAGRESAEHSWDWDDIRRLSMLNRAGKLAIALAPAGRRPGLMDRLAQEKVRVATACLSEGRMVVTDRLHGLILADLIGRRITVTDNATGKVTSYVRTWGALLQTLDEQAGPAAR